jgi:hypothetical protein
MGLHSLLDGPGREAQPILFRREHVHQLPTACDERGERLRLLIGHRPDRWANCFVKVGKNLGIQPIGLDQLPGGPGKVPHIAWIDDDNRHSGSGYRVCEWDFKTARRLLLIFLSDSGGEVTVQACSRLVYPMEEKETVTVLVRSLSTVCIRSTWKSEV